MKVFLSLLTMPSMMASAYAGGTAGNGGNAVVCYANATKKKIVSIEMFDHWEMANEITNHGLDLGPNTLSVIQKINLVHARLKLFDPSRADAIKEKALRIAENIDSFLTAEELEVIDDDHSRISPKAPCYKEQFAIQIIDPAPHQKTFLISKRLYTSPQATNDARTGLILHEVIYQETLALGATSSDSARYFNFMISTALLNEVNAQTAQAYAGMMKKLKFTYGDVTPIYMPNFNQYAYVHTATIKPLDEKYYPGYIKAYLVNDETFENDFYHYEVAQGTEVAFYENKSLFALMKFKKGKIAIDGRTVALKPEIPENSFGMARFAKSGAIWRIVPLENVTISTQHGNIPCRSNSSINFNDNQSFKSCYQAEPVTTTLHGETISFQSAEMRENGSIKRMDSITGSSSRLTLAGCNYKLDFTILVHLDEEEKVIKGVLKKPISISYRGRVISDNIPMYVKDCKVYFYHSEEVGQFKVSNRRVLAPETKNGEAYNVSTYVFRMADATCKEMDYLESPRGPSYDEEFIVNEEFYDIEKKAVVTIKNKPIKVFKGSCADHLVKDFSQN